MVGPKRHRWLRRGLALIALVAIAGAVVAVALTAQAADRRSRAAEAYALAGGDAPLAERIAAAERAVRLEPDNVRYAVRAAMLSGRQLLDAGQVDDAFWRLYAVAHLVSDDPAFRATYQEAVRLKTMLDSRKAHVQHSKENEDGSLAPEDVQR